MHDQEVSLSQMEQSLEMKAMLALVLQNNQQRNDSRTNTILEGLEMKVDK
jgi:hypothetical protein